MNKQEAIRNAARAVDLKIDNEVGHWHSGAFSLVPDFFKRELRNP